MITCTFCYILFDVQSSSTMGFIFGAYPPGQMLGLQTAAQHVITQTTCYFCYMLFFGSHLPRWASYLGPTTQVRCWAWRKLLNMSQPT
jgi:hypothetical protein